MTAEVALTKQAAARRLISSAVILARVEGDPLAIHLLAASALNLLRELLRGRGPDYVSRAIVEGLFQAASRLALGEPAPFATDPYTDELLREIAERIKSGNLRSADDIKVTGPSVEYEHMKHITGPFNFLKHADRDPLAHLNESAFRPVETILHAVCAYVMLFPDQGLDAHVGDFAMEHVDDFHDLWPSGRQA